MNPRERGRCVRRKGDGKGTGKGTLPSTSNYAILGCIMPRGPRLDAPGVLHHVMVRGLERRAIFRDDRDRADFVRRLAAVAIRDTLAVYAWALLPNHAHLLVRTGRRPLGRSMRAILTGYAGAFNRRHGRTGHLFQNRYKSVVVEEEPYFLELIRYLHLNPLRAGLVRDLRDLERYRWTGHAAVVGRRPAPWQDTEAVLARFARIRRRARVAYRAFVAAGLGQGRRPDLQGGGLRRSLGGWAAVRELRRGRERWVTDERVLGSGPFVERLRREGEAARGSAGRRVPLEALVGAVCRAVGIAPDVLQGGGRRAPACRAREGIAYLWMEAWGRSGWQLAPVLGVRPQAVYLAARRGRNDRQRWDRVGATLAN